MPRRKNQWTKIVAIGDEQRLQVGKRTIIFKRARSPNWYIEYCVDGKQFRSSLRTTNLNEAIEKAEHKDVQLRSGQEGEPGRRLKIEQIKEKYLTALQRRKRRGGTVTGYRRDLEQFIAYAKSQGVVYFDRITADLIGAYQDLLEDQGVVGIVPQRKLGRRIARNKPKTVWNKLKTIKQMSNWAFKKGHARKNPAATFDLPMRPEQQAYCWKPEELQALLAHADPPWSDIFNFLMRTGLRPSEFCWLWKEDLCLTGKPRIYVRSKTCPVTGGQWLPKSASGTRTVPLCAAAEAIARRAYDASPGPWLFWTPTATGPQKGRYAVDALWRALQRIKKKAGVTRGTTHTFRHVFCSAAANSGVPAFQVMKILGHESMDIVLIYYHDHEDSMLSVADQLNFDVVLKGAKTD
jgi:site-specific recombinase XerD